MIHDNYTSIIHINNGTFAYMLIYIHIILQYQHVYVI